MVSAGAVILTPPVPQSLALLDAGRIELPTETRARLEGIEYESCLVVMASLDGPAQIPRPGSLVPTGGPIAWIADNQIKVFLPRRPSPFTRRLISAWRTGIATSRKADECCCKPRSLGWGQA